MLDFGTKISDDDQKNLIQKIYFWGNFLNACFSLMSHNE